MCRRNQSVTEQPPFTSRTVSGIVVGDFPGTVNDLNGPVPDYEDLKKEILSRWSDIAYRGFKDKEATRERFLSELNEAVLHVGPDGMLFIVMDVCHAESNTRNGHFKKMRNIGYEKVLVFSSSLSSQTSADATFLGGPNGAWHYALKKTIEIDITYRQWFYRAVALLKKMGFDQTPVIEGSEELQSRKIFEGNIIMLQVSSHGGQQPDRDGDEADNKDEVIFFYDGKVTDDEIRAIIDNPKRPSFLRKLFRRRK